MMYFSIFTGEKSLFSTKYKISFQISKVERISYLVKVPVRAHNAKRLRRDGSTYLPTHGRMDVYSEF